MGSAAGRQLSLQTPPPPPVSPVLQALAALDPERMTPLEALTALARLKSQVMS